MKRDMLYTIISMPVSITDYTVIKNFLEDFDLLEGLPDRDNIFLELAVQKGAHKIGGNKSINEPVFLGNLQLMSFDGNADGRHVLIAVGESEVYEKLFEEFNEDIEESDTYLEESQPYVVICNNYDKDHDLEVLSTTFVEYLQERGGVLSFEELQTRYYTEAQLVDFIYDGIEAEDDE
jgi:hypothetical protein